MIVEYHRPDTLEKALELLARDDVKTVPMGGGSWLNQPSNIEYAVVDLQELGLDAVQDRGNFIELGATVTLQDLVEIPRLMPAVVEAIRHEAAHNLRHAATVAGTLVAAGGRSPLTTTFLALDATVTLLPGEESQDLGNLLPFRSELLAGRLISRVSIPLNARVTYHYVARSPADQPIVCAAAAQWPSGRTRVALGGYAKAPLLAFDGTETVGGELAAKEAYSQAGDQWASAEYRREIAGTLTRRCLEELSVIIDQ
jgi:CO/xanthine dehydrogenase FAD-binding subunit